MKLVQILMLSLLFLMACTKKNNNKDNCTVYATIIDRAGLDGCKWVLQLKDGSYLEPTNLSAFGVELTNNKAVLINYTERQDLQSICMIGKIVDINCMKEYHQ